MFNNLKTSSPIIHFSIFQLMYNMSVGIVVPFFSIILTDAGWSISKITYFFSISAIIIFLFAPIIGKISDIIGKRKVIFFGLVLQTLFFIIYFLQIENQNLILFMRGFEIISFICIGLVGISAIQDLAKTKRGTITGVLLAVGTIGALLGPIIGGFITQYYQSKILLLFSIPFSIISVLLLILLPEFTKSKDKFKKSDLNPLSELKHFLVNKKLQGVAILGILANSKAQIYLIFFPILVISQFGISEKVLGILLAIPVFMKTFQFIYGKISDMISSEFGILFGVSVSSIAIFFLPYAQNLTYIIILLILYGIGSGIWNVNCWSLIGEIGKQENIEGEVVGSYFSIAQLGVFFSTLISATLVAIFGISTTLQVFASLLFIGSCCAYFFLKPVFHHEKHGSYFKHSFNHKN